MPLNSPSGLTIAGVSSGTQEYDFDVGKSYEPEPIAVVDCRNSHASRRNEDTTAPAPGDSKLYDYLPSFVANP